MKTKMEQDFLTAYDAFADAIFRYCYFRIGDKDQARDMTQDIFLKSWSYLQNGKQIDNFKAFLYRSAHNMIIDWYRKKRSISLDTLTEEGYDPADTSANTSQKAEIENALSVLSKLEKDDQDIVLWRLVEDMSIGEIASILNESENTVSVRLHRAMAKFRKLLQ